MLCLLQWDNLPKTVQRVKGALWISVGCPAGPHCWTGQLCSRAEPREALGQSSPSGVCWLIPAPRVTHGAKYLVLHDEFHQCPVPSHRGDVGWMEPARTALCICAELPWRQGSPSALPQPLPAPLAQVSPLLSLHLCPHPFSSPYHINFLEAPDRGFTPWRCPRLLDLWPHKILYLSVGSLREMRELLPPLLALLQPGEGTSAMSQQRRMRPVLQGTTDSSLPKGSLVSQAVPDPPSESPGRACVGRRIILGYWGNHSLFHG